MRLIESRCCRCCGIRDPTCGIPGSDVRGPTRVHVCCIRACAACARACNARGGRAIWSGSPTARGEVRAEDDGGAEERGAVERGAGERGAGERGAVERGAGERGAGEHDADEVGGGDEPRGGRTTAPAERGAERAWEACAGHASGTGGRCGRTPRTMETTATTTVAAVEATETQPAAPGTAQVSCQAREGQHVAGSRGQTSRRQAGAGADSPGSRRDSVALVMLVAGRGRCQRARSARHRHACGRGLEGDAGGDQSRAVPGEVVRRSRAQQAARVRGGRRAEGRARRTSGTCAFKAWTRDRLNVGALQPD